jgi:hypothetical protein
VGRREPVVLMRAYRRPPWPADPLAARRRPLLLLRARRAKRIAQKALLGERA